MSTILLVEDNPHIQRINSAALRMEGYQTLEAATAAECLSLLQDHEVDLILLDIMLPDGNGIALCAELRERYDVPILFLSALGENRDIITALRAGGDDYLAKPYDIDVLLARVEARLRAAAREKRQYRIGDLTLDTVARIGYCAGSDLLLTQKEFSLLLQLARRPEHGLRKEALYEAVWGRPMAADSAALYTAVSRLNAKLAEASSRLTISYLRGQGYQLEEI